MIAPSRYITDDYHLDNIRFNDDYLSDNIKSSVLPPNYLTWEDSTENILNEIQEIITKSAINKFKKNVGIAPKASELKPIIRSNKERKKKKKEERIVLNKDLIAEYLNDHPEIIKNYVISYLEKNLVDLREHTDKLIKNNISNNVIKDYLKNHLKVDWVKMNVQDPNGRAWGATERYGIGIYLDNELISKTVMGLYL